MNTSPSISKISIRRSGVARIVAYVPVSAAALAQERAVLKAAE
jgi:hypothetical protein